jgi:hypothetical protein
MNAFRDHEDFLVGLTCARQSLSSKNFSETHRFLFSRQHVIHSRKSQSNPTLSAHKPCNITL